MTNGEKYGEKYSWNVFIKVCDEMDTCLHCPMIEKTNEFDCFRWWKKLEATD